MHADRITITHTRVSVVDVSNKQTGVVSRFRTACIVEAINGLLVDAYEEGSIVIEIDSIHRDGEAVNPIRFE